MRGTLQMGKCVVPTLLLVAALCATSSLLLMRSRASSTHGTDWRRSRRSELGGLSVELTEQAMTSDGDEQLWVQSREYERILNLHREAGASGDADAARARKECLRPWRSLSQAQLAQKACQQWALKAWPGNGVIIYRCLNSGKHVCGGLADRVRGMAFMYWLAVLRRAAFFIDSQSPTNNKLETFWQPATINWTLPEERESAGVLRAKQGNGNGVTEDIGEKLFGSSSCSLMHFDRNIDVNCQCLKTFLASKDLESAKVLDFSTTHHWKCMSTLFQDSVGVEFSHNHWSPTMSYLFSPSPLLKSMAKQFKKLTDWSPSNTVCLHLRSGGPIGPAGYQMHDNVRTGLAVRQTMYRCAAKFSKQHMRKRLHKDLPILAKPSAYLVIVDHDELVDEVKAHLKGSPAQILSTAAFGPMLHIDKVKRELRESESLQSEMLRGERRAYMDHYLLSMCRYAVVDSSGFAWTALNYAPLERIVLRPTKHNTLKRGCSEANELDHS